MGLWTWAVEAYGQPGVREDLLELQDGQGQNVCLLLWAAWCAAEGRPLERDTVEEASDIARTWEDAAIAPLRKLRRGLKKPIPDMEPTARESVRDRIKAAELAAEKALLEGLDAITPAPAGKPSATEAALAAAARAWGPTTPRGHLAELSAKLSGRS
ncbi:MAG TPA: TIGR02444 family protein [Caulobacteraceae bacterium]|nr:TIGR02444 family protein [Caulobacteraceae bacterium]